MIRCKLAFLSILIFYVRPYGQGQTTNPVAQDINRNFQGKWVGVAESLRNGIRVKHPMELTIAEIPTKHQMRFDYIYRDSGKTDTRTRFVKLDPKKKQMKMHDKGQDEHTYEVVGLEHFAQTGLGEFTASSKTPDSAHNKEMTRVTFRLESDTLSYEWEIALDGQHYGTSSLISLRREGSPIAPPH